MKSANENTVERLRTVTEVMEFCGWITAILTRFSFYFSTSDERVYVVPGGLLFVHSRGYGLPSLPSVEGHHAVVFAFSAIPVVVKSWVYSATRTYIKFRRSSSEFGNLFLSACFSQAIVTVPVIWRVVVSFAFGASIVSRNPLRQDGFPAILARRI